MRMLNPRTVGERESDAGMTFAGHHPSALTGALAETVKQYFLEKPQ
jgi:hypothetical protein